MKKYFLPLLLGLTLASTASAGTVTIPNTFTSGQPAIASQVNENFDAVKFAIDSNSSNLAVLKDGNNSTIGSFVGVVFGNSANARFIGLSSTNYLFSVFPSGEVYVENKPIYFSSTDCTGQGYVSSDDGIGGGPSQRVFSNPLGLYYVPAGNVVSTTFRKSVSNTLGICSQVSQSAPMYQVMPNDPVITGMSSGTFTGPITIGHQ